MRMVCRTALIAVALIVAWYADSFTANAQDITYNFANYPTDQHDYYEPGVTNSISGTIITNGSLGVQPPNSINIIGGSISITSSRPGGVVETVGPFSLVNVGDNTIAHTLIFTRTQILVGDLSSLDLLFGPSKGGDVRLDYVNTTGTSQPSYYECDVTVDPDQPDTAWRAFPPSGQPGSISASDPWVIATATLTPGDFNQDGHVDTADIQALELALTDLPAYKNQYGVTDADLLQINQLPGESTNTLNNSHLQALLNLLKSGGGSIDSVPEPSTFVLALIGLSSAGIVRMRHRKP
jgi:hypothetical protein